ncbi:DUF3347 domain-containing protein [uncultured Chitinophaga sp.]|uniref:DUF3347 domain-containing protein n=1 Tax=uncultured Chitinophaga sp. TaxID=339340 RepID=UPI0025CC3AAC|nr:DUF3347 domain-containing protein [uncultured Chitinophaga sp.]
MKQITFILAILFTINASSAAAQASGELDPVFEAYFSIKDALVKSDAATATGIGLLNAIERVKTDKLSAAERDAWTKALPGLTAPANAIAGTRDLEKQRVQLAKLSEALYPVAKAAKPGLIYYQHCPMYLNGKGANWLSRDKAIKNPFYGTRMLTCGSTKEEIK